MTVLSLTVDNHEDDEDGEEETEKRRGKELMEWFFHYRLVALAQYRIIRKK